MKLEHGSREVQRLRVKSGGTLVCPTESELNRLRGLCNVAKNLTQVFEAANHLPGNGWRPTGKHQFSSFPVLNQMNESMDPGGLWHPQSDSFRIF